MGYRENTTTTHYVRSAAVDGQVLVEVNASGQKLRSYVYGGQAPLATQEGTGAQLKWEHRDPTNVSIYWTYLTGDVSVGEYDPLGVPAPDVPGLTHNYTPPYNGGSFSNPDMGCLVDRIPTPCDLARRLLASGIAVPCRNNDCGPQRFETPEGPVITKPYQCFADGYCDYLPVGVSYVGDGYIIDGEHARFEDLTGDLFEGLVGNFAGQRRGTIDGKPGRKKGRRRRIAPGPRLPPTSTQSAADLFPKLAKLSDISRGQPAPIEGRLTPCARSLLRPYFPGLDLSKVALRQLPRGVYIPGPSTAMTQGYTILYEPGTLGQVIVDDLAFLGHEITHTRQQAARGLVSFDVNYLHDSYRLASFLGTLDVHDDLPDEKEADRMRNIIRTDLNNLMKQLGRKGDPCPP